MFQNKNRKELEITNFLGEKGVNSKKKLRLVSYESGFRKSKETKEGFSKSTLFLANKILFTR